MGVETRHHKRPPLPTATESDIFPPAAAAPDDSSGDDRDKVLLSPPTDLATDVSRCTDKTSHTIPEDGRAITINTTKPTAPRASKHYPDELKKSGGTTAAAAAAAKGSQTSLLIEYFEGGKGSSVHSRPSVRVKVTPSSAKGKRDAAKSGGHIQVTEAAAPGARKPSYTRRISLGPKGATGETQVLADEHLSSLADYAPPLSPTARGAGPPPVEIEVLHKAASDVSGTSLSRDSRYVPLNPSQVSSMPPESFADEEPATPSPKHDRSRSFAKDAATIASIGAAGASAAVVMDTLKTPSRRRSRSLSRERIAQKAAEKVKADPGRRAHKHSGKSASRSRSVSKEYLAEHGASPRAAKHRRRSSEVAPPSGAESSLLTASQVSDGRSLRSDASKASLQNPKLLATVEDAIRRLILPELTALKAEQKTQQNLRKFEKGGGSGGARDSLASGSSASKEELTRRVSKHASDPNVRTKSSRSGEHGTERRHKRREKLPDSPSDARSFEREMSEETVIRDSKPASKRSGHGLRNMLLGATAAGGLTTAALHSHDSASSLERREQRRQRRRKDGSGYHSASRSRSHSISTTDAAETVDEIFERADVPPMPLRDEGLTNSDLTRDSILSERTSTPSSEHRRREVRQMARGSPRGAGAGGASAGTGAQTPTRSPGGLRQVESYDEQEEAHDTYDDGGGHGYGKAALAGAAVAGAGLLGTEHALDQHHEQQQRYEHARALSPIQSVASFEAGDDAEPNAGAEVRHAHSTGSLSSAGHHAHRHLGRDVHGGSAHSLQSADSATFAARQHQRPAGISLESGSEIMRPHAEGELAGKGPRHSWYDEPGHEAGGERYRDSVMTEDSREAAGPAGHRRYRDSTGADTAGTGESYDDELDAPDARVDVRHLTNYTDDSMDAPHLDKVTAAQAVRHGGAGAAPDYVHTPHAVESAVASLHEPSLLGSTRSGGAASRLDEYAPEPAGPGRGSGSPAERARERGLPGAEYERGSPLKRQLRAEDAFDDDHLHAGAYAGAHGSGAAQSPRQSVARSQESLPPRMTARAEPDAADPLPEFVPGMAGASARNSGSGSGGKRDSDISTNPPAIQGPRAGPSYGAPWSTGQQPGASPTKGAAGAGGSHDGLAAAAKTMLGVAAGLSTGAAVVGHHGTGVRGGERYDDAARHLHEPLPDDVYDLGPEAGGADGYGEPLLHAAGDSPIKDEGYITGDARAPSAGAYTPDPRGAKDAGGLYADDLVGGAAAMGIGELLAGPDPFVGGGGSGGVVGGGHARHPSGNSHGMPSPVYDSATGRGIDRIQSKDVVALMDHLTVRDAQRNARDTEILMTLVRSAAEMRTSFEDMKLFIREQDELLVAVGNKQHEKSQRVLLGGPRPAPPKAATRTPTGMTTSSQRAGSADPDATGPDSETPGAKRRNVFRRALKGLSGKNSSELANIELMLNRLLDEVAELKAGPAAAPDSRAGSRTPVGRQGGGGYSYDTQIQDPGYEPEGQAGTSSTGDQSGYFSNPPSRQGSRPTGSGAGAGASYETRRRASENRVSTVMEEGEGEEEPDSPETPVRNDAGYGPPAPANGDDYDDDYDDDEEDPGQLTPTRARMPRGGSVPLDTPPTARFAAAQQQHAAPAPHSAEHTPRTDKSRKHKSSSSSFFPRITSRWSKTTASSVVDTFRGAGGSARKERPISGISQSGSEDVGGQYETGAHYDPAGDDRLRSNTSLQRDAHNLTPTQERRGGADNVRRPPSPLVPSALSHASDQPQYSAHRDSVNLQHPQPRPGPTARYQNALESQAAAARDSAGYAGGYGTSSPLSPSSDAFGPNSVLARFPDGRFGGGAGHRHSGGAAQPQPPPPPAAGGGSGHLSPISDRGYEGGSRASSAAGGPAPPRPPKIRDDGPLIPPKEPLDGRAGNAGAGGASFAERAGYSNGSARKGSPSMRGAVPARKPVGPRPQAASGSYGRLTSSAEDVTF